MAKKHRRAATSLSARPPRREFVRKLEERRDFLARNIGREPRCDFGFRLKLDTQIEEIGDHL